MSQPRTALLVVDVQAGMYMFPEFQPHNGAKVIENINALIAKARNSQTPVIFVRHEGDAENPLAKGTAGYEIDPRLNRLDSDTVIEKSHCVSFRDTDLESTLKSSEINHLIICGIQTDHCVDSVIRIAVDRGFTITAAKGAHTTFDTDYMPASKIIQHHEAVWADSFGPVQKIDDISFGGVA